MGFVKMVNEIDAREAANQGMVIRPLTQANIQKHLESVGLESEFATHSRMRGLSGEAGFTVMPGSLCKAAGATHAVCCQNRKAATRVGVSSCLPPLFECSLSELRLHLLLRGASCVGLCSCLPWQSPSVSHACCSRPPAWQVLSISARHILCSRLPLLQHAGLASHKTTLHTNLPFPVAGGQRMKCVMGAATWNNPHIIVLDEPSNFLDRDSLGALTAALKGFGGGVLIISHNKGESCLIVGGWP